MKKIIFASILALAVTAGVAHGYGNGWNGGPGCGKAAMGQSMMQRGPGMMAENGRGCSGCPGKGGAMRTMEKEQRTEFLNATSELRKAMHMKKFEFKEASRNSAISPSELAQLEKEIIDLRVKIQEKAEEIQQASK